MGKKTYKKTFSAVIYSKIHKKAMKLFSEDLLRSCASDGEVFTDLSRVEIDKNYELLEEAWLKAAEEVYKEFEAEGLSSTCQVIREMINWNKKHFTKKAA